MRRSLDVGIFMLMRFDVAAMGCGAYRCPPRQVAEEMKVILQEAEFKGRFREIIFAVYSKPDQRYDTNFEIFSEVFKDVAI